jgi:hypothetical protein
MGPQSRFGPMIRCLVTILNELPPFLNKCNKSNSAAYIHSWFSQQSHQDAQVIRGQPVHSSLVTMSTLSSGNRSRTAAACLCSVPQIFVFFTAGK